jgi:hypothetical protein
MQSSKTYKHKKRREKKKMKINGNFILGVAMIVIAVMMEIFWFQTGSDSLGVFSLIAALAASGALARFIRLDYETTDVRFRKTLKVMGLEI